MEKELARRKTSVPNLPSREKGQRSLDLYINRIMPPWSYPHWQEATFWRQVVRRLPVAMVCRETLTSYMTSLEWKVEARDNDKRDELKPEIEHYTKLFEAGGDYERSGWDFVKMLEFVMQDYLDTPFGGAVETIREGDKPDGKVLKIIPIDSATLFPTLRKDYPVGQRVLENPTKQVYFPYHAVNRIYMSPRTEIRYEGWGMPPPEKIYLAMEMLRRGDIYYAKFLVDTPEAGILDLIDMDETSAKDWVTSFQELFMGIEPMKIPVLYEHTSAAQWIPFGKDPHAVQFERTYHQYTTIICSGYGLTPTDIGFPSVGGGGGQTLAGSIRDERRTKRSGMSRAKDVVMYWFNRMLPENLQFRWVDLDDEASIAISRARLANATGMAQYVTSRIFTENEARKQTVADGLFSIALPEDVPEEEFITPIEAKAPERPGMLGKPVSPSSGGMGEVLSSTIFGELLLDTIDISDVQIIKLATSVIPSMDVELGMVFDQLKVNEFKWYAEWHDKALWGDLDEEIPELVASTIELSSGTVNQIVKSEEWFDLPTQKVTEVIKSLVPIFEDKYISFQVGKSYKEYVNNERNDYLSREDVPLNKEIIKNFKSDMRSIFRDFWSTLDISKSTIAGVRNFILKSGYIDILDNIDNLGNNIHIVNNVREELLGYYNNKVSEFADILEKTIYQYLEEDLNE